MPITLLNSFIRLEFIILLSGIELTKYLEITRIRNEIQLPTMFSRYL